MREPGISEENRRKPTNAPEFYVDEWLFIKQIPLKAGELVAQHVHEYDHVTFVGIGTVRAWIDGADCGEVTGPKAFVVKADQRHTFLAVTDALLFCAHNLRGEGYPAIKGAA